MKQRSPTLEGFQTMFRLPSLGLAEIAWRWSFGLAAAAAFVFAVANTCPRFRLQLERCFSFEPSAGSDVAGPFTYLSGKRSACRRRVSRFTLTLAVAWIVLASFGRAATSRQRPNTSAVLLFERSV